MGREYTDGNHSKSSVGIGNLESLLKVRVPQEPLVFSGGGRAQPRVFLTLGSCELLLSAFSNLAPHGIIYRL